MPAKGEQLNVRLDDESARRLARLAERFGGNKRRTVLEALKALEGANAIDEAAVLRAVAARIDAENAPAVDLASAAAALQERRRARQKD